MSEPDKVAPRLTAQDVADAFRDAERLRNLAARFEERANWGGNYSGAEIAAMLRGDGA